MGAILSARHTALDVRRFPRVVRSPGDEVAGFSTRPGAWAGNRCQTPIPVKTKQYQLWVSRSTGREASNHADLVSSPAPTTRLGRSSLRPRSPLSRDDGLWIDRYAFGTAPGLT